MQYHYITTQAELNTHLAAYANATVLAIDTEFMRRRTLYPELALIQIFDGQTACLIDPLCELDLSEFWHLMINENIVKVLHSPSEDLEVFLRHAKCVPTPLFDTQFALTLLGKGNCVGFANMVEQLLGVVVDKSQSRTDWLKRPLTNSQLDYACADVTYLLPCYQIISQEIDSKGWRKIVYSETAMVAAKREYETPDDKLYLDVSNSWKLYPESLNVLKPLAIWRRNKAKEKNLALSFICKEQCLIDISMRKPTNLAQLKKIPELDPMSVNRNGKAILEIVATALAADESSYPERIKRLVDFPQYKKEVKKIKHLVKDVADETGIDPDVFASKKQINGLLSWCWKLTESEREVAPLPDLISYWRGGYLTDALAPWIAQNKT